MSGDIARLESEPAASEPLVASNAAYNFQASKQTAESVVQDAVDQTGFGKFNLKIMAVCSLIFMNVAFSITSIGFVIPSAACDFKMTTVDKGCLSAAPMLGMLAGSYIWGCYAAIKGRRMSLLVALFLHGISELLASIVPLYWVFLFLKFLSGAAMNGQSAVVFLYLGEFQPTKYRDRMLSWMEMAWVMGMIILAGVGWIVIPMDVNVEGAGFFLHSWNLFVFICSLPALFTGTWLLFFPETPKYLAETGYNVQMLQVLMRMYAENTGQPAKEYKTKLRNSGNNNLNELVHRIMQTNEKEEATEKSFDSMIKDIYAKTVMILKPPYLCRTIVVCLIACFVTSAYYTLTLWLPELFHRYADFQQAYPNRTASVCTLKISINHTDSQRIDDPFGCNSRVQTSVFLHTFILGASCIPTGLIMPFLVNYMGYKFLLVITAFIPGVVAACLFLVQTSTQNLILSCAYESVTSVCLSVVYCLLVDLYPTHLRAMASGLSAFISRIGAISGTLMIGYLIDDYCTLVIVIVAAQLFLSGLLALFTPSRKKPKLNIEKS
ncbi:synaptic vesicle glycoprotein 2B isoform X1 [Megachile rotundata]|uniref:synaptic vesicle glycoprotein 2B isoform X1 n=1 Tax=Megachile rotundata TaxID=143995 RepID=UPI000258E842|nr:PREDICTED: synaptic vesicle glycoprotein 2C-like isoform X2 [Megachile rotundata]